MSTVGTECGLFFENFDVFFSLILDKNRQGLSFDLTLPVRSFSETTLVSYSKESKGNSLC